jgi:hypothetical protein
VGESTQQIEQEIAATRSDLGRNLDELEGRARELADWRTHYREHSAVFVGAAFVAGAALAFATIPRARHGANGSFDEAMGHHPMEPRQAPLSASAHRAKRQLADTWDQIADALLRLASAKVIEVVGDFVPGFRDQLSQRDGRARSAPVR